MEIFIDVESGQSPAFSFTFEPEGLSFSCNGGIVCIGFQAFMQCCSHFWRSMSPSLPPIILTLHGLLCCPSDGHNNRAVGANLVPSDELPIKFPKKDFPDDHKELLNLTFHCPSSYIQYVEERRAINPETPACLQFSLWGTMLISAPTGNFWTPFKSRQASVRVHDWDKKLSSIGYPQVQYLKIPAIEKKEGAEVLNNTIDHLNEACSLFNEGRYNAAMNSCRKAKEALLGDDGRAWCDRYFAQYVGPDSAAFINSNLLALGIAFNSGSHDPANGKKNFITIERDIASYVIGSMTLILDYIGKKIR